MKKFLLSYTLSVFLLLASVCSCGNQKEHTAPAINPEDSVAMMTTYGVNTLISDSGVIKYRIVAESWEVNEVLNPPRWIFRRGVFMEQFDEKFHAEAFIQADTAYNFTSLKLWHLIGHVSVKTIDGLQFASEELYWDENRHEFYSNKYSKVVSPEREIEGAYFISDDHMQHYKVTNTKGAFSRDSKDDKDAKSKDSKNDKADTVVAPPLRSPASR